MKQVKLITLGGGQNDNGVTVPKQSLALQKTNRFLYRIKTLPETRDEQASTINLLWALQQKKNVNNTPEDIWDLYLSSEPQLQIEAIEALNELLGGEIDEGKEPEAKSSRTSQKQSSKQE